MNLCSQLGREIAKSKAKKSGQARSESYKLSWAYWDRSQFLVPVMQAGKSMDTLPTSRSSTPKLMAVLRFLWTRKMKPQDLLQFVERENLARKQQIWNPKQEMNCCQPVFRFWKSLFHSQLPSLKQNDSVRSLYIILQRSCQALTNAQEWSLKSVSVTLYLKLKWVLWVQMSNKAIARTFHLKDTRICYKTNKYTDNLKMWNKDIFI